MPADDGTQRTYPVMCAHCRLLINSMIIGNGVSDGDWKVCASAVMVQRPGWCMLVLQQGLARGSNHQEVDCTIILDHKPVLGLHA